MHVIFAAIPASAFSLPIERRRLGAVFHGLIDSRLEVRSFRSEGGERIKHMRDRFHDLIRVVKIQLVNVTEDVENMCLLLKTFRVVERDRRAAFDAGDSNKKVPIDIERQRRRDHRDGSRVRVVVVFEIRLQMSSDLCRVICHSKNLIW